jgi:hypothetical protein
MSRAKTFLFPECSSSQCPQWFSAGIESWDRVPGYRCLAQRKQGASCVASIIGPMIRQHSTFNTIISVSLDVHLQMRRLRSARLGSQRVARILGCGTYSDPSKPNSRSRPCTNQVFATSGADPFLPTAVDMMCCMPGETWGRLHKYEATTNVIVI